MTKKTTILDKIQIDINNVWNSVKDDYKAYAVENPNDNCRSDLSDFAIQTGENLPIDTYINEIAKAIKDKTITLSDIGVDETKIDATKHIRKEYIRDESIKFIYDKIRDTFYKEYDALSKECEAERKASSGFDMS